MAAHAQRKQEDIPPTLPPRPGGRAFRPPPVAPPSQADEPDPDDVYDDCEDKPPPPLPPLCHQDPEVYDDCDEHPPLTPQGSGSLPSPPSETYDDLDNVGPVVQQLPRRQLPPPPSHLPSPPPATKILPPPPIDEDVDSVYEIEPEGEDIPPPPPVPQLPPKNQRQPPRGPAPPVKTVTSPGPMSAASPSPIAIGLDQLKNAKAGLRKVSSVDEDSNNLSNDPKEYGECPATVSDVKKKFQNKMEGKPEVLAPKPAMLPKAMGGKPQASNHITHPKSPGSDSKPGLAVGQTKVSSPSDTAVTFLAKSNKDKPNIPSVPAPPQLPKPVAKYQPTPAEFDEPDDIYDDAASADVMDRYDWYHGSIDRNKGENRVKSVAKDGTFLVRVSDKDPKFPYTLVVFHKNNVNNLRIRKRADNKIALGDEKSEELAFTDVPALIDHHKKHHLVLLGSSQSQVKLQHVPPKG